MIYLFLNYFYHSKFIIIILINRLEGEKSMLQETLDNHLANIRTSEGEMSKTVKDPKPKMTIDDQIAALGDLPPSIEEIIAKLKNQVAHLMQVSHVLKQIQIIFLKSIFYDYIQQKKSLR